MKTRCVFWGAWILCSLLVATCTPYNNVREEQTVIAESAASSATESPVQEPPQAQAIQPEPAENEEATQETAAPPEGEASDAEVVTESENYPVSREVYERTFTEIERVIEDLNTIIQAGDFQTWTTYLTWEYVDAMSSPENLRKMSQKPILKKYDVRLKSLEDYFRYVVAPSRSHVRLDDIVFLGEGRVKAIMQVDGQRIILYQLEKRDGLWKIGIW